MADMPRARDREEYEKWFEEADKNHDGHLNAKELKRMFKNKGYKVSTKVFKAQFAALDRDGNKKITKAEYLIAMGQVPNIEHKEAQIRMVFTMHDKNGDGVLDHDEMKSIMAELRPELTSKQIFDVIHKADRDRNGRIDYNEFLALYFQEKGYE